MSFLAGKKSNFMPITSVEDFLSRDINGYFSAIDQDLSNLFLMASPVIQFGGIGNDNEVPQSQGDGTYQWSGTLGGWNIGGDLLWAGVTASYIGLQPSVGIWMGDEAFLSAPFSVDTAGVLTAHSGEMAGWTISATKLDAGLAETYIALIPGTGIQMGHDDFDKAPFSVTNAGVLKSVSGTIAGWTMSNESLSAGSGINHIELKTTAGIWLGADSQGSAGFSVDRFGVLRATIGTLTGPTFQTSADPGVSRVIVDSAGLRGYGASLGLTFKIPTDGSAPIFASGTIQSATIIDTTLISSTFKTSSELPWVEMGDSGVGYRETLSTAKYGSGIYYGAGTAAAWDDATVYAEDDLVVHNSVKYIALQASEDVEPGVDVDWENSWEVREYAVYGVGVTAWYGNSSMPILSILAERSYADVRLYNRSSDPSGAALVGDLMVKGGILYICTTAGTPGTYTAVGDQTAP